MSAPVSNSSFVENIQKQIRSQTPSGESFASFAHALEESIKTQARGMAHPKPLSQSASTVLNPVNGSINPLLLNPATKPTVSTSDLLAKQPFGAANYHSLIFSKAKQYHVDPALVWGVMKAESGFNPSTVSHAGAMGLMQLMPATARSLGVADPYNPEQNIDGGVRYLRMMLDQFNGDVQKALAAYNAGPEAVKKYNGIPPFEETQTYIPRVLKYRQEALSIFNQALG